MTTPTQLPIPSNNLLDSRFNFEKLDQIVNSDANYYVDRFGKQRLTAAGLQNLINQIGSDFQNDVSLPDGFRFVGKSRSFAQLRTIRPLVDGQRILLNGWYEGSSLGGGEFEGKFGTATDDGGSIAAGDGYYWERKRDTQTIFLSEYGVVSGMDITDPLSKAVSWSRKAGITTIVIPGSSEMYTLRGGIKIDTTQYPCEIRGGSGVNMDEVAIHHVYDPTISETFGIKFYNTNEGSPSWKSGSLKGIYAYCDDTTNALHFVRFADGWRNNIQHFHAHGYVLSAAIVVCNEVSWTEDFYYNDLNIRHCKMGIFFYSKSAWPSFFGLTGENFYFNHGSAVGGSSTAIVIGGGTAPTAAFVYAGNIDLGGWLGTVYDGDPHKGIYVRSKSALLSARVTSRYDGVHPAKFGDNFRMFVTESVDAIIDVEYHNFNNQWGWIKDVITIPLPGQTNSYRLWDNLCYPTSDGITYTYGRSTYDGIPSGARCPIQIKGGKMVYRTNVTSTADLTTQPGIIKCLGMPVLGRFMVELRINGSNHTSLKTFEIQTHNQDLIASVKNNDPLMATTETLINGSVATSTTTLTSKSLYADNELYCRTINNLQPGTYSAGNGQGFEIVIPPAVYRGTVNNSGTPVPGAVYGIEIEITQI